MPKPYKKTVWNKKPRAEKAKKVSILAKNKERKSDKPYRVKQADKWFSYYVRLFYSDKSIIS